jgi:hypothetical protein
MPPQLTQAVANPSATVAHRTAVAAADSAAPAAAAFCINPGDAKTARLWVTVAFTGGTTPTIDLTPYLKPHNAATPIGQGEAVEYNDADGLPAGTYVIDVAAEGSDLFAYLDNVSGSPSAFAVTVVVQWI